MNTPPVADMSDEIPPDVARLRKAIANELHAQLALRAERIELADIPEIAYAVAVQLRYGFRIEWAPTWVDERDDGDWLSLDAATFHGSATGDRDGSAER